jgi:glycine cleavage system H lipoate-binding protein
VAGFELPEGIFYAPWHTWARIEGGGRVRIGIDDFAQRLLGRIYAVEIPRPGARVHRRTSTWRVAHSAGETVLRIPVTGVVREVNERLLREPSLANRDPYGQGAALVVEPARLSESVRRLLYGEEARAWCEAEVSRFREEVIRLKPPSSAVGATLQDGGTLTRDLSSVLEPAESRVLIRSFLSDPAALERDKR